jgi:hypothetical protein
MATTVKLTRPVAIRHHLRGYGAQFDCELFTKRGQPTGCTKEQLAELKQLVNRLKPGHSRIFVTSEVLQPPGADGKNEEREALMKTIAMARESGANVNLTWWSGPYFAGARPEIRPCKPRDHGKFIGQERMAGFAGVIEEARKRAIGGECITHVTIQNEVNYHDIGMKCSVAESQKLYKRLYTILDNELTNRPDPLGLKPNLRRTVDFVGGDLLAGGMAGVTGSNQRDWLAFMQTKMTSLLDGYSIHVYTRPGGFQKVDTRMNGLRDQIKKFNIELPIYVTEYGIKTASGKNEPGVLGGKNLEDTVEAAFEHAWFNALAPQYGCVGFAKWVLCRTDGPERKFLRWGMICSPGSKFRPLSPTYFVTSLFNHLVDPGWTAAGVWRSSNKLALVSRFDAPHGGNHSIVALNRGAIDTLQLAGLKPHFPYQRAIWNAKGAPKPGVTQRQKPVLSSATGKATVTVQRNEMVVLSTRPIVP